MKKKPVQKYSSGVIQLFPLILVVVLVAGALIVLQPKTGRQIIPLKNDVLSESESKSGSSNTETPKPTEIEENTEDEVKDEVEVEDENEVENEEEFDVESGTEEAKTTTKIKIKSKDNKFHLTENEIEAETNFPLSVDKGTRELKITTPAGEKIVAILPQQAVENMLAGGTFELILKSKTNPDEEEIEIEEEEGKIVYKITGANQERLFGIFNVLVPKTAVVSAETGETLSVTQTFISRVLDLFSS